MKSPFLGLLALQTASAAITKRAPVDHGWQCISPAPRDGSIKLHIAIRQADGGNAVEQQLLKASDPNSATFRQHLTAKEVAQLSQPSDESVNTVQDWLRQHGLITSTVQPHGICEIDTTISVVENMLNASYHSFSDGTATIMRTEIFYLPDGIAKHIDFITPTTMFPNPSKGDGIHRELLKRSQTTQQLERRDSCGPNDYSTPTCIRQVYGINYTAAPNRTTFAVFATEGASATYDQASLQKYLEQYNKPAAAARPSYIINGAGDPANEGGIEADFEVALDTQALLGLAWPAQGILYNRGGVFGPNVGTEYDRFVAFLTELMNYETVPSVVSFSESQPENLMDRDYALRLCNMMAAIGDRGVTLIFSSGNNGANGDNASNDPPHKAIFEPKFPASCLWVTSVGGTTNLADEQAATKSTIPLLSSIGGYVASGGGFSNYFPAPSWQAVATTNYISTHVPTSYFTESGFSRYGRGIPDVSAFSTQFPTYVNGFSVPIGGTSAAAPTWAAIITLLNDYQASKGRPTLGFINPWLYSLKYGLKDIVKGGNNKGDCSFLQGCRLEKTLGYDVTEGWDPVTGLGSPLFSELIRALDDPTSAASPP
ncbi:hypothetical protein M409DRAFT_68772 [Zasmidium cellare ATCC 36951]|uniref:tripeptidyl-peptidase II n=1 Tax=Zasmidium cellare ATCC 36951 TaxID=1080233 RepID=A0A6A6C8L4_ZASCE|nr:uncharacterized protein M409DRAFT_68772 [Zasmidium cellare ATCC 36951]KAF2163173.1 hypothetical protein M409DRAFT_68772 [Zasmidium cellare ATCC 36951]